MKFPTPPLLLFCLWTTFQQPGVVQQPVGDQQAITAAQKDTNHPPASANRIEMEQWLNEEGKVVDRLVGLGVDRKIAEAFVSDNNLSRVLMADWAFPRTEVASRVGILFLPCSWTDSAYLYILQNTSGAWRITDQSQFDCHYDAAVSMELVPVRDPNRDEIIIHRACGGRGTGYLEQSFSVLLPLRGKLKVELETDEVLRSFPVEKVKHDLDQKSTFTIIPIGNSESRAIEETRSKLLNDKLTVQRRIFRWDRTAGRYRPSGFTPVEAPSTN
jgi:hypothetical protein